MNRIYSFLHLNTQYTNVYVIYISFLRVNETLNSIAKIGNDNFTWDKSNPDIVFFKFIQSLAYRNICAINNCNIILCTMYYIASYN